LSNDIGERASIFDFGSHCLKALLCRTGWSVASLLQIFGLKGKCPSQGSGGSEATFGIPSSVQDRGEIQGGRFKQFHRFEIAVLVEQRVQTTA